MNSLNLKTLQTRTVSGIVLGIPAFAVIWFGGTLFVALVFLFLAVALLEWFQLSSRIESRHTRAVLVSGTLYIVLAAYAFYILGLPERDHGAFVVTVLVVCSDIGAYFAGKLIGGPKMMELVSPNKTWAGFAGSVAGSVLVALLCFFLGVHIHSWLFALVAGIAIGVSGQAGDLIMSFAKRQAGVKDTGALLPGHGGLLDRVDSFLLSIPVFILISSVLSHG